MYPTSNKPAQLYGTAKTLKFEKLMKYWSAISKFSTYFQTYLKPLCTCNEYIIGNRQNVSKIIQKQSFFQLGDEYVSYNVESLIVLIVETIHEIYVYNKLPKLCNRLIIEELLLKLTTENTYIFQIPNSISSLMDAS